MDWHFERLYNPAWVTFRQFESLSHATNVRVGGDYEAVVAHRNINNEILNSTGGFFSALRVFASELR